MPTKAAKSVVEEPVKDPVKPDPNNNGQVVDDRPWRMPRPHKGQAVIFYYRSTVSEQNADIAFVSSVGDSLITVSYRGIGYDEVLHIDDPRLKANPDLRKDIHGVWDFTKESIELDARLKKIEERLDQLS